jgi:TRAP-type C4-dicarboxylate transport system substrate-binding protein
VIWLTFAFSSTWVPVTQASLARQLREVEEMSEGRIMFKEFWGTLVPAEDLQTAGTTGLADVWNLDTGFYPGQFVLNDAGTLPFLLPPNSKVASIAQWRVMQGFPEMIEEFTRQNMVPLQACLFGPYFPWTSESAGQIKVLEDFEGKRLRTFGGPPTVALQALGAAPLMVPFADLYMAIDTGVVDGTNLAWASLRQGAFAEVVTYITYAPLYYPLFDIVMNLDSWNALPADLQGIMMKVFGERGSEFTGHFRYDVHEKDALAYLKEAQAEGYGPHEVYYVPQEELERWAEVGGPPSWEAWYESLGEKSALGERIVKRYQEIVKEIPEEGYYNFPDWFDWELAETPPQR